MSVNGSTILGAEQEESSDQDDEQGKVILLKGCDDCLSHFMAYNCTSIIMNFKMSVRGTCRSNSVILLLQQLCQI